MADRFDKFTERARRALTLAQEEALRLNNNFIGTEHILLALGRMPDSVAGHLLQSFGLSDQDMRSRVEQELSRGNRSVFGEIGLTPGAMKTIELAVDEARRLGERFIGTEHLLLGLIREGEGMAAGVLGQSGVTLAGTRERLPEARAAAGEEGRDAPTREVWRGTGPPLPSRLSDREVQLTARLERYSERIGPVRYDALTERASRILTLAQEEALRFAHNYIGTEHLLLALIRESNNVAGVVLRNLGVDLDKARSAVEFIIGRGDRLPMGEVGLTPGAKIVLELAVNEARRMGHHEIGAEHLLLGLIREGEGIAAGVLESLGVSLERVRAEVVRMIVSEDPEQPAEERGQPATIIDGKAIAAEVRAETKARADRLHERGIIPGLALVLAGDNPSSLSYVRSKGDAAEQAGIYSDMFHFPENVDEQTLISRIMDLNEDNRFHAILVQLPLPRQLRESQVVGSIDPAKDVDGVTAVSMGRLLRGEPGPWPATPAGVVEMLHRSGNPPAGKHVVVCGRSNIVGKPLAGILMQKNDRANATVTLCHAGTQDLASYTRQADILISAMGSAGAITADMVKPGAIVIDVGNNWVDDPSRKSGRRLVGDVDFDGVRQVAAAITPVPGGVGPMTVAMLLSNTVYLAEQQAGRG